jgi:hypothetical protein
MQSAWAQIAINNSANPPHASAMLDITSTTKGLLAPRMTQAQRDAIANPANGLLIYQTDNVSGFYYNVGTPATKEWILIGQNLAYWGKNGNHIYKLNPANVGIGTLNPEAYLEISGQATPQLIIKGAEGGFRPGIQFKNNYIHYISGDDLSDENFGFYSTFGYQRAYGASLHVYGPTAASWGTYVGLKHDGTKGYLYTDVGDLILQKGPNARVGIGIDAPQRFITIDGGAQISEVQFVNTTSGKAANDGATIGILPSSNHASFWNYENADLYFGTNNTRYLSIKSDGKIGMGINSPSAALHIQSNSSVAAPTLMLTEAEADEVRMMFKNTPQSAKHWLVHAGINASDPLSKLSFTYNNGVNTPQELFTFTAGGELKSSKTGAANLIPIAYGHILPSGNKANGTNNFTSAYYQNESFKAYHITLSGIQYNMDVYVTLVSSMGFNVYSVSHWVTADGKLSVFLKDKDGNYIGGEFTFIIFKP